MIEKSASWIVTPKNSRANFNEGVSVYIESIKNDQTLNPLEKAAKISTARKEVKQYINKGKIISYAIPDIKDDAAMDVDEDWLAYFFEYAKNISNESVQTIWGKILAEKCNGNTSINRKLISVLSMMDVDEATMFAGLCSITFNYYEDETNGVFTTNRTPNNVPLVVNLGQVIRLLEDKKRDSIGPYFECATGKNDFLGLVELGLIEKSESPADFSYRYNGFISIEFNNENYRIVEEDHHENKVKIDGRYGLIKFGCVKFTLLGNALYELLSPDYCQSLEIVFKEYLKSQNFRLERLTN